VSIIVAVAAVAVVVVVAVLFTFGFIVGINFVVRELLVRVRCIEHLVSINTTSSIVLLLLSRFRKRRQWSRQVGSGSGGAVQRRRTLGPLVRGGRGRRIAVVHRLRQIGSECASCFLRVSDRRGASVAGRASERGRHEDGLLRLLLVASEALNARLGAHVSCDRVARVVRR